MNNKNTKKPDNNGKNSTVKPNAKINSKPVVKTKSSNVKNINNNYELVVKTTKNDKVVKIDPIIKDPKNTILQVENNNYDLVVKNNSKEVNKKEI